MHNKEHDKEYSRKYRKEHPEWKKESNKKYNGKYHYDKEKKKEWNKKWAKKHPDKFYQCNKRQRIRRRNAEGSHTLAEWELLKKRYEYCCPSCGKHEPEIKLTEDHICPLVKGGTDYIVNIQPLCGVCNSKKGVKYTKVEKLTI
jgi:5-methylcytosine-specific restriction endonuclease McrA